ncbi:MAG: hypothetical protein IIW44_09115 [Alistipes sp.]|nr:hypothetical protein [Alistipes sp.]
MKQLRYFFAIVASALLMVACQEDFAGDLTPNNGTLKVRFEVPTLDQVEITRGAVEETEAYDVRLYIFKGDNLVNNHPYDIELTPTNENSYTRKYEVDTEINLEEGTYEVYAIANTESNSLWQGVAAFDEVETKAEFVNLALTLNTIENTSKRMTLSGHATFTASASMPLAVDIQLSRPYAKINFNVKNGTVNPNFKFTPTSYDIINVPTKAKMFANTAVASSDFRNYESRAIPQSGSFEFIQLENAYNVVSGPAKYTDREKRVSDTDRTFAYAPATSTYVVIYGEGVETDENGHIIKISKTNYTIHLGDFSPTGNMGDYSVNRNTHYTYNVTVNGVNMIEVEAKRETVDYENGAEGYVIDMSEAKQVYNLDAHYETVLLKLDISNIEFGDDASTVSGLTMSVSSPLMADADKNVSVEWKDIKAAIDGGTLDALYSKYDAKWVEFMPVANNQFAAYKSDDMFYVCEFLNEIYKEKTAPAANNTLTIRTENGIDYIYVVAFINEYFYEGKDLSAFVNKPDREMKILQSPEVSTDGASVYSQALCAFSQKSISTMYNLSSKDNIYGIETYDETGYLTSSDKGGESKDNGWANMKSVINGYTDWADLVNDIQGGYSYEGQPNGNTYDKLVKTITRSNIACGPQNNTTTVTSKDAIYACMQRNRDNNGDGIIDDNELRWYTPAHSQYCAFWFGEEALPTYARLYQGLTTDVKSGDEHNNLHHYFTSTYSSNIKNYRIIWAIEGSNNGAYPNGYIAATHNTRCIRNLRSVTSEPATAASQDGYILTVNNFVELAYRNTIQNGPYPKHHEREIPNKLPHAFKVASRNLNDDDLKAGNGGVLPTLSNVIKAPNISSAVSRDGQTTLTFVNMVNDGTIGYYYTTTNTASQNNRIEIVNNQATIDTPSTAGGGNQTKQVTISSATRQGENLLVTLNAALPDGVSLWYANSTTGAKMKATSNSSSTTQYICGKGNPTYIWLSADGGDTFSASYATITTNTTYQEQNVTISGVARSGNNNVVTLSAPLPTGVTLHYATSTTGAKTRATRNGTSTTQYICGTGATTYVWVSTDGGATFSDSYATITTTTDTTTAEQKVTISGATREGSWNNYYFRLTLSKALPTGLSLHYATSENGTKFTASRNGNSSTEYNCNADGDTYASPTYVWLSADGGKTFSSSYATVETSGNIFNVSVDVSNNTLSIGAATVEAELTSGGTWSVDVPNTTTTIDPRSLSISVPTPLFYVWAYDQSVRDFSYATVVTSAGVVVGEDKIVEATITTVKDAQGDDRNDKTASQYNAKRDRLRLAATTMDLCAGYTGDNDPSDAPKWRVPNQRELTIMNLNSTALGMNTDDYGYFSSTQYSNAVNATKTTNQRFSYGIEKGGNLALVVQSQDYAIRCVRDLAPSESNGSNGGTDGDGNWGEGI